MTVIAFSQPRGSFKVMWITSAWKQLRTVAYMRNVVLCDQSMLWHAPRRYLEPIDATSRNVIGLYEDSWKEYLRNTALVSFSATVPIHCVVRGGGRPLYPPVLLRRWRARNPTVSTNKASAAGMPCAGQTWSWAYTYPIKPSSSQLNVYQCPFFPLAFIWCCVVCKVSGGN